ncbi:MAG: hypothetical protein HQM02_05455 [Magnetococcales bacterium]|nr:hypothetical protein [Magnetococcales bacterium]
MLSPLKPGLFKKVVQIRLATPPPAQMPYVTMYFCTNRDAGWNIDEVVYGRPSTPGLPTPTSLHFRDPLYMHQSVLPREQHYFLKCASPAVQCEMPSFMYCVQSPREPVGYEVRSFSAANTAIKTFCSSNTPPSLTSKPYYELLLTYRYGGWNGSTVFGWPGYPPPMDGAVLLDRPVTCSYNGPQEMKAQIPPELLSRAIPWQINGSWVEIFDASGLIAYFQSNPAWYRMPDDMHPWVSEPGDVAAWAAGGWSHCALAEYQTRDIGMAVGDTITLHIENIPEFNRWSQRFVLYIYPFDRVARRFVISFDPAKFTGPRQEIMAITKLKNNIYKYTSLCPWFEFNDAGLQKNGPLYSAEVAPDRWFSPWLEPPKYNGKW